MQNFSSHITAPLSDIAWLEDLLIYLKQAQQVDLTGYKRPTLLRRTRVRMQQIKIERYQDYLDYVKQQPDEVAHLLDTLFVNYTYFFRDPFVWNYLQHQVIPQIIANKAPNEVIRVWSAGCASGEETYSLAMLLAEALGIEQFQQRVQLYGTDVDLDAVLQARRGRYSSDAVAAVPPELLERYFEPTAEGYCWRQQFSRSIIFHSHNLIQFPPLSRIDLLVCRNTLMYFTPEAQLRALVRFHFSVQPQGFLLLGQPENLVTPAQRSLFNLVGRQAKVFTKVPDGESYRKLLPMAFCCR
jgi:two-component system CheB/CheR fusion protein